MGLPRGCAVSCLWADGGTPPLFSEKLLEECPRAPLYGPSSRSGSTSSSQKVTLLPCWGLLRDLSHLSKDQLCSQLLLWLWGQTHWTSLNPWCSLSILPSSTWAASSALWQAALASWRASSCGSFLLLGLDWDPVTAPVCLLWLWQGRPVYADGSLERPGCPRLLLFSAVVCKVVDQVTFSTGRCCDKGLWSLCGKSGISQVSWQVGLPLGQALVGCTGSLMR